MGVAEAQVDYTTYIDRDTRWNMPARYYSVPIAMEPQDDNITILLGMCAYLFNVNAFAVKFISAFIFSGAGYNAVHSVLLQVTRESAGTLIQM